MGQSRMVNTETLATLDTPDTGREQTKHRKLKIWAIRIPSKTWVNPGGREG